MNNDMQYHATSTCEMLLLRWKKTNIKVESVWVFGRDYSFGPISYQVVSSLTK